MKCLTLTQPWATLVAIGAKTVETRDWATSYRGDLLITASKKFPADCRALAPQHPFSAALGVETLHTGQALCVVELYECFQFDESTLSKIIARSSKGLLPPFEYAFGDYGAGRYGLVFRNLRLLKTPIPCRGALGIWKAPPDLEEEVNRQFAPPAPALDDSRPVVKKRLFQALDGKFDYPVEKFSLRSGPTWYIVERGPRYSNTYEVLEFNAAAEKWLTDHRRET